MTVAAAFAATFSATTTATAGLTVRVPVAVAFATTAAATSLTVTVATAAAAFALVRVPVRQFLGAGLTHRRQLHFEVQINTRQRVICIQQHLVTIDLHHAHNRGKLIGPGAELVTWIELTLDR